MFLRHLKKRSSLTQAYQLRSFGYTTLPANTNQAQGLAEYAIEFMGQDNKRISDSVYDRTRMFHTDSVLTGISALA